jgi:cyclopropane fatty-acyl-phospholipid synthase-like methyltransferase
MSNIPDKTHFESAYEQKAPWDIPGPQPAFVEVADEITGAILDAGCGTGEHALFFAERGNSVTGIDYIEEAIRRAKEKAADRRLSAKLLVMDALALTKLQQRFDNAIDCGLFHCFSDADQEKYVEGLASVLNKGGRVFLLCFSDAEPGTLGPRRILKAELQAAFANGWEIESISPKRIQVIPEFQDQFSEGGPKAWFVIVRRV